MTERNDPVHDWSRITQELAKGNDKAFTNIFHALHAPLVFFAAQCLQERAAAEDIVQDVFLKLWKNRKILTQVKNIRSYLYTITRNQCYDWLQSRKRHTPDHLQRFQQLADEQLIEEWIIRAETLREIHQAVLALPPRMQQVFKEYYFEDRTTKEISELMQTSPKTTNNQRDAALRHIRERIIPEWKSRFGK